MKYSKIHQIVFGIADDILIVGYDADKRDCDRILRKVMQISHQDNLKLKKKYKLCELTAKSFSNEKENCNYFRYNSLPRKVVTIHKSM